MRKPVIHLICNAHLDPVWLWRWDEGASVAITTFAVAARLLREFPEFVFNHNESTLYRWVLEHDPELFREIQRLVREGRWCIAGGWDIQPDVNMPGTEALIRHIAEGRLFFREHFDAAPRVAYNFDSFGHPGGLPGILTRAGYVMYLHMRPGANDLRLPADLYRWEGVDGSVIGVYRMPFPAYNTYPGKAVERIAQAVENALRLDQDTPVFWGLGDHGGGATREDLLQIRELMKRETRAEIIHSSTERYYLAVKDLLPSAPLLKGELQRVFTGCYTSMSRLKRRMQRNLGELVQSEALRAATWWQNGQPYPDDLRDAWRDHLFNDFHDILAGSSIEPGEQDALDLYGRSSETARRLRLGALAGFRAGEARAIEIPLAVLNATAFTGSIPVEAEYMVDFMPIHQGTWHARLATLDGTELLAQEEAPEQLVIKEKWRRKICFEASLPNLGAANFRITMREGSHPQSPAQPGLPHVMDPSTGRVIRMGREKNLLAGEMMKGPVVADDGDSWGMERWSYRDVVGEFAPVARSVTAAESGPVRTITESRFAYGRSELTLRTIAYAAHPWLEFRIRLLWNEERKRLKLSIPTAFDAPRVYCEIPGGAMDRPADGQEYVQGRWMVLGDERGGDALAVINSGQYGFDVAGGELRLSVLRSVPYAFEHTQTLSGQPAVKVMDQGVHDLKILVAAGPREELIGSVASLAEWISAPPYVMAHYPVGEKSPARQELLTITPSTLRLIACKRSWDGRSLVLRVQESAGVATEGLLQIETPRASARLSLPPFAVQTLRVERDGTIREVALIEEV